MMFQTKVSEPFIWADDRSECDSVNSYDSEEDDLIIEHLQQLLGEGEDTQPLLMTDEEMEIYTPPSAPKILTYHVAMGGDRPPPNPGARRTYQVNTINIGSLRPDQKEYKENSPPRTRRGRIN